MDFNSENNSIFEGLNNNSGMSMPQNIPMPENQPQQNLLGNFINSVKNKLDEAKQKKESEQLEEQLTQILNENSEILLILKSFGCRLNIKSLNMVEIISDEFHLNGHIYINNENVEMDEECKKLFHIISTVVNGGYRIEDILNKYEEEDFYPIGEIEQIPVIYKGTEIQASRGRLANPKGEIRTIIFYRGYEIQPDNEIEGKEGN